jgi:trimeric autotransporter adhesin
VGGGGGGGGGETPPPNAAAPPADPPPTTAVGVTVIDGPIRNALVCLDADGDGTCSEAEAPRRTDASGRVTLQVPAADAGRYPVVAVVGTDAEDADHGAVPVPFVLKAPKDRPAVVSPLTTLVQTTVENTGASSADAEAALRAQMGVAGSLFQDFTASPQADNLLLGAVARLVVVTAQQQSRDLQSVIGNQAADGQPIRRADVERIINQRLLEILPTAVAALAGNAGVQQALSEGRDLKTVARAAEGVRDQVVADAGLNSAAAATLVAITRQPAETTPEERVPSASLSAFTFNSPQSWSVRALTFSQAQITPDSAGRTRYIDRRSRAVQGAVAVWSARNSPAGQTDFHWNGSAWVQCAFNYENLTTPRDAQGRSSYDYCDRFEHGTSTRALFNVEDRPMREVYQQVRDAGYTNLTIADAANALGNRTFPKGSRLIYQNSHPLGTAVAYNPGLGNAVRNVNANVAAGRASTTDTAACTSIRSDTPRASYTTEARTLESLAAANPGRPCVFSAGTIAGANNTTLASGPRNEWWSNSTLSLGEIGSATLANPPAAYYTGNQMLRVAFGAGQAVTYYSCQQKGDDGSARNCNAIGTGRYAITTLGDGRVMRFENLPPAAAALSFRRVFVERGGKVHFGYENRGAPVSTARLNLAATNALLAALSLPTVDPDVPLALTPASYQGEWVFWETAKNAATDSQTLRLQQTFAPGTASSYQCFQNADIFVGSAAACTVTAFNAQSGAITFTDAGGTTQATLNFSTGAASGSRQPAGGGAAIPISGRRR